MIPDSNSAVPLYRQIARDLINRIDQGEFYTGQCIPSEARLWKRSVCKDSEDLL